MKIALIRPNMGDFRSSDAMPPLAMGILAARCGEHEVLFYDDKVEQIPERPDADVIAMTVETFTARRAYQLADHYRDQGKLVVMGGHHPTLVPEEALQHCDTVVAGDAEGTWETVLSDIARCRLQRLYHGDNTAALASAQIDRSIFLGKAYAPIELIQFGRGCRFACDFCSIHAFYGSRVRVRPLQDLCRELARVDRKRLLFFVDDNLYSNRRELDALLEAITPFRLRWSCQISIDVARDPALLDRLAQAGCRYVLIGFESLDRRNLVQMRKNWNSVAGEYSDVVRAFHGRGIGVYGTFVFGYDHDTPDTIRRSLEFALDTRLDIANFNPLTPTPGSGLYERLDGEGRLLFRDWWMNPRYRYGDPIFVPAGMKPEALTEGCYEAKRQFYAWSSIATRLLGNDKPFSWFNTSMTAFANLVSRREVYRKQGRFLGA